MPVEKNKITARQLIFLFVLVTVSPGNRLFPRILSQIGGVAGWTAPALSAIAVIALYNILHVFFQNDRISNLSDVFDLTIGKIPGKILLVLYLVWTVFLYFLYIRYYAERLLSSIFPNTNIRFFIITMLLIVYIVSRGRITSFARFCEFSFLLLFVIFILFFLTLLPTVKVSNLLPLTYYDIWPAMKSTYPVLGIWGYLTFLFFLGDHLIKKGEIKQRAKKMIILLVIMNTVSMICVIGSLGPKLAERMPLPFFNAIKQVSIFPEFDRIEAILLSIYVISDFIIIAAFMFIIMNIVKKLFKVSEVKYFSSPLILLGYTGSLFLATDRFELEKFSSFIGLPLNIAFGFAIPFILFIVGKIRKVI